MIWSVLGGSIGQGRRADSSFGKKWDELFGDCGVVRAGTDSL